MEHRDRSATSPGMEPRHQPSAVMPEPIGRADERPPAGAEPAAVDTARVIEILSHELRSPITSIHLGAKVLREAGRRISRPLRLEVVEAVEVEAERLHGLVEDLLAVARHEATFTPIPVGPLLIQHWLPDVLAAEVQLSPTLVVRVSIPPGLPPVMVDDGALAHVIHNLLLNAVRHATDGMPVEVVAWPPEDGSIRVEVLDRGPGIDEADADRLFHAFYRAPAAEAQGSGAGLGLAAARLLLEAMGGRIEALPRPGGGARFVMTLLIADPDPDEDAELPPPG